MTFKHADITQKRQNLLTVDEEELQEVQDD